MKIAIISDIHSNLEALKTTLNDIKQKKVDKIFCLGDIIAKGIHPNECVELIKDNCDVVIQGNCDRYFSKMQNINKLHGIEKERVKWHQETLTLENKKYLSNLPYSYEFYMSGSLIILFHATPEYDDVSVINYDTIEVKSNMFKSSDKTITNKVADIVIYGHIHNPYMDRLYNKTIINVGSIGNAFEPIRNEEFDSDFMHTTRSSYLIIEGEYGYTNNISDISFQFVNLKYDINKELEYQDKNIEKDNYIYELVQGRYRNMDKIKDKFKKLGINI